MRVDDPPHIGLAGWSLPSDLRVRTAGRSALARYAELFNAVEVNSTHYKFHLSKTFARWAADVPAGFRFAVKMHRNITHLQRLTRVDEAVRFLGSLNTFGDKLGVVLLQLPPSLAFSIDTEMFLRDLASEYDGSLAVEPRHPSWAEGAAEQLLRQLRMARVAADPPLITDRVLAAGDIALRYYRFHGNPQMYRSVYSEERLAELATIIATEGTVDGHTYVFFNNTMSGAAHTNAFRLRALLSTA